MEITKMKTDSTGESLGEQYPNVNYCKSINLSLETLIRFFDFKPVLFLFVPNDCFRYAGIMQGDVLKVEITVSPQEGDKIISCVNNGMVIETISSKVKRRWDDLVLKIKDVVKQTPISFANNRRLISFDDILSYGLSRIDKYKIETVQELLYYSVPNMTDGERERVNGLAFEYLERKGRQNNNTIINKQFNILG